MNKSELVADVAQRSGLSKSEAQRAVEAFTDSVTNCLRRGEDSVALTGFGTFSLSRREAREGRNPQTGEAIEIPVKNSVKFKPGKTLKDSVN